MDVCVLLLYFPNTFQTVHTTDLKAYVLIKKNGGFKQFILNGARVNLKLIRNYVTNLKFGKYYKLAQNLVGLLVQ